MAKSWIYFWAAIIAWYPILSCGYLNVFISHRELLKLVGLEADLFYVHEGTINTYAMHFNVPVPAELHELEFTWQSLTAYPLPYAISIELGIAQDALAPPTLSIPAKGFVPQQIESFHVHLPCTGNATMQVPLTVNMVVRAPPFANDTKLHFKRTKICEKGIFPAQNQSLSPSQASSQAPALLSAAACALAALFVIGLVISGVYVRARQQLRQDTLHSFHTTTTYGSHQNVFIHLDPLGRPPSASGSYATITSLNKYPMEEKKFYNIFDRFRSPEMALPYATALLPLGERSTAGTIYSKPDSSICPSGISFYATSQITQICDSSNPKINRFGNNDSVLDCASSGVGSGKSNKSANTDSKERLRQIPNVQPGAIQCQQLIRQGTYGRIFAGKFGETCDLLIKTVVGGASLMQVACLLQDATMLIGVSHRNVLVPMLANTELPGPPEIAYAYPSKGNLKVFLQKSRKLNSPLRTRQLVELGLHIAKGLAHLHSLGIIHRDVGTRNCFVDLDFNVRICDSALSRDLFPHDYHRNRPLKWLALETLQKDCHSGYSDIWMLGILFWELATLALTPFDDIEPDNLITHLSNGLRLRQPFNCPDEFFTVMSCCWLADPKQRPTLPQLLSYLQDFYEDLGKYI